MLGLLRRIVDQTVFVVARRTACNARAVQTVMDGCDWLPLTLLIVGFYVAPVVLVECFSFVKLGILCGETRGAQRKSTNVGKRGKVAELRH